VVAPSRRRFLTASAAAAVLAIPRELRAALPPAKAQFGEDDFAVLDALKAVLYGPGAEKLDIRKPLAESLGFLDEDKQAQLASLPSTFDRLSMVLVPTFGSFIELSAEEQVAALQDWIVSPLAFRRQVGQALRQLVLAHCYTNEAVWPELGYPGPWLGRVELPVHPLRFGEPT
jgi:hypothetical protein